MSFLDDPTHLVLEKSMDALWLRNRVLTDNVANATTPGYKRKGVSFENELRSQLNSFSQSMSESEVLKNISSLQPRVYEDRRTTMNVDENNVDLDREYLEMTNTMIQYQYMERLLSDGFSRLRHAITEGRG